MRVVLEGGQQCTSFISSLSVSTIGHNIGIYKNRRTFLCTFAKKGQEYMCTENRILFSKQEVAYLSYLEILGRIINLRRYIVNIVLVHSLFNKYKNSYLLCICIHIYY